MAPPAYKATGYTTEYHEKTASHLTLGFLKLDKIDHYLKLRKDFKPAENWVYTLGADYHVESMGVRLQAAGSYRIQDGLVVSADDRGLRLRKTFHCHVGKLSWDLHAFVSKPWTRDLKEWDRGAGFDNVQPIPFVLGGLAVILAAGVPLTYSRNAGEKAIARGFFQTRMGFKRQGWKPRVAIREINPTVHFGVNDDFRTKQEQKLA